MDTVSTPTPQHSLHDKWNLYYHLPHNKNWDLASYTIIMNSIDTVEKVICLNETIHENVVKNCMLFVMRDGITPMWEDPRNRNGGCFSYKVINKSVAEVWKNLFYGLCGESLCVENKYNKHINGITISPKKNFCIIKIWLDTSSLQDPNAIIQIPNLLKQGCLFKKHEPEF
jgi:hypothetical protein|uniref:Eukaryotic translation initiation factor 4E n=1 Tax=viral metagenome TaxID=1070528 RepID=A0A6C0JLM8_9ZZZZ